MLSLPIAKAWSYCLLVLMFFAFAPLGISHADNSSLEFSFPATLSTPTNTLFSTDVYGYINYGDEFNDSQYSIDTNNPTWNWTADSTAVTFTDNDDSHTYFDVLFAAAGTHAVTVTATVSFPRSILDLDTQQYTPTDPFVITGSQALSINAVQIQKLKYRIDLPGSNDDNEPFADVPSTPLIVPQGTYLCFLAVSSEGEEFAFPNDDQSLEWSDMGSQNYRNEARPISFFNASSTPTDYMDVTATCGNTVTAQVLVVGIEKLQYRLNGTGAFANVPPASTPLVVPKGTNVEFKAITSPVMPNGDNVTWPSGKPLWGGTAGAAAGATGTGETKSVTFGEAGNKTVTAECGNTKTANVLVTDYSITSVSIIEVNGAATPVNWDNRVFRAAGGGRTVKVEATITTNDPDKSGKTVYWFYDDPDEPSGHVPNDTDTTTNDNDGPAGVFSTSASATDANGKARAIFTLSNYGGDNYILKASKSVAGSGALNTQAITVWKRLVFERPDSLVGYSSDVSLITDEFAQIYVQIEENLNTGDAVDPSYFTFLSNGGGYGPRETDPYVGAQDRDILANYYQDATPNNSPSGMGDYQNIGVRAEGADANGIRSTSIEPYSNNTADYQFGTVTEVGRGTVIDFANSGDLDPTELNNSARGGVVSNTERQLSEGAPLYLMLWHDGIAVEAMMIGKTKTEMLKNVLWHEAGHAVGLYHTDADDTTSIMNGSPFVLLNSSMYDLRELVDSQHWSANEATKVRRDWHG